MVTVAKAPLNPTGESDINVLLHSTSGFRSQPPVSGEQSMPTDDASISLVLALPTAGILLVVFCLITALVFCRVKKKFASQDPKLLYYCSSVDPAQRFVIVEMTSKGEDDWIFATHNACRCHGNETPQPDADEKTSADVKEIPVEGVSFRQIRSFSEGDLTERPSAASPTPSALSTYTSGTFSVDDADLKALGTHKNAKVLSQSEVSINVHSCPPSPLYQHREVKDRIGVLTTQGHPHFYAGSGIFIPLSASEAHLVNLTSQTKTNDVMTQSDDVINGCQEKRSYAVLAYRMGQQRLDAQWEMRTNL
ncbi:hypothetical protein CAPTEDRAFT_222794 [Capitella teleta]|uniref:Uncharacterized protein n=1 Tax=Capitella teleta TaxID=283909 RepID=R7VLZ1_CAPTE|nr:hypothetical protein CAPTEDRAFT_222794 [Capitella teleta]|eukprot:ELU18060.1 hypothetical protein CAPTEDRAFT_222794 [Capitella teleta]